MNVQWKIVTMFRLYINTGLAGDFLKNCRKDYNMTKCTCVYSHRF